jgi:putative transposase
MKFIEGNIYHIYNRGINRRPIFFNKRNYQFFKGKMQEHICRYADLLAWVLMPNHFHFLLHANEDTCRLLRLHPLPITTGSEGIRLLLSSHAKAIQRQEKLTGNVFQQKTKAKLVNDGGWDYSTAAFHYIHQNPYRGGLVERVDDWEFSSLHEYATTSTNSDKGLCNVKLAFALLEIEPRDLIDQTYRVIPSEATHNIYHKHRNEESF